MEELYDVEGARMARENAEVESWTETRWIDCEECDESIVDGEQYMHREFCEGRGDGAGPKSELDGLATPWEGSEA